MLITSLVTNLPDLDPLIRLKGQTDATKFYLKLRDSSYEWAGFGNLFDSPKSLLPTLDWSLEDYEVYLKEEPHYDLKFFVINDFDLNSNKSRIVLPRFEVLKENNKCVLKINLWNSERAEEFHSRLNIDIKPEPESTAPRLVSWVQNPSQTTWPSYFESSKKATLKKVVLARQTLAQFDLEIDPYALLAKMNQTSYRCFFQLDNEVQIVSVSPERLFRIENQTIFTEAVAGTRPRGSTPEEDMLLETELKTSAKDGLEHQLVIDEIYKTLQDSATQIFVDPTKTVKLKTVQHLKTEIQAELLDSELYSDTLKKLHPTPAVGGLPKKEALTWLRQNEPFKRDYYSAPIGILSKNWAEFFVNIRSAQIQRQQIKLYSGVGVIPESNVDAEWNEMSFKEQQYWDALKCNL